MKSSNRSQWLSHLVLIPLTLLTLFPVLAVVKMALRQSQDFDASLNFWPTEFDLSNFETIFGAPFFWQQLFNSVVIAVATTLVGIFLSCTAAYAFSRYRFPGRRAGMMGLLMTQFQDQDRGQVFVVNIVIIQNLKIVIQNVSIRKK